MPHVDPTGVSTGLRDLVTPIQPKFVKDDYSDAAKGWRIPDSQAVDWWTSSHIGAMLV